MWIYRLLERSPQGRPSTSFDDLVKVAAAGQTPHLGLAPAGESALRGAAVGTPILFGRRFRRDWSFLGSGVIAGPIVVATPPDGAGGADEGPWLPLRDLLPFAPPRSAADLGLRAADLADRGRVQVFEVAPPAAPSSAPSAPPPVPAASPGPPRRETSRVGLDLARGVVSPLLYDGRKREQANLAGNTTDRSAYIIELNVQHIAGLPGAAHDFEDLYLLLIPGGRAADPAEGPHWPIRIAKSYYQCEMSVEEWSKLLAEDERRAVVQADAARGSAAAYRSIYRLWPDFQVSALVDRSAATVKADAARRTFDAAGDGIVWAVLDSGIDGDHPHFAGDDGKHTLDDPEVAQLHRSFVGVRTMVGTVAVTRRLESPDVPSAKTSPELDALIQQHRRAALTDDFGHGTHVAGIIAGAAPTAPGGPSVLVYERQFKINDDGLKSEQTFGRRPVPAANLGGIARRCKLVSLKVLDEDGRGSVSSVIMALDYIREKINDNPRVMRIHGVNLSLGYAFDPEMFACGQSPICVEVNRLVQSGVVVVAAAGNSGYGQINAASGGVDKAGLSNTINDPGNAASAITVGATHRDAPHTYGVSYFSSKGPTGDGRLKPDLVAPGERITSCAAGKKRDAARGTGGPPATPTAEYVDDSGTSMAAPHVSGAVAAFLSIRREYIGQPLEVKQVFLNSATPLGRERYFEGHGLIDLMRAIQSV